MAAEANYARWLYAILKARTEVTYFVGTRIYPIIIPEESAFPAISYSLISHDTDDAKGDKLKVHRIMFQVNMFGGSYGNLKLLETEVRRALLEPTSVAFLSDSGKYSGTYFKNATEGEYDSKLNLYHLIHDYEMRIV